MSDGMQPVGLALIVCDAIYQDQATGKRTLLGTFSAIYAPEFPVIVPSFAVYAVLTDCRGIVPLVVRVVDVNEEREPVATVEETADDPDPLAVVELEFRFTDLEFPAAGEYSVQLLSQGAIVSERRITLGILPDQPTEEGTSDEQ